MLTNIIKERTDLTAVLSREDLVMEFTEMLQSMSAVAGIIMITVGLLWTKKILKEKFVR